jgi:hypothetical protein
MNTGRILDEGDYTLDEESFIANYSSIEMCDCCGTHFAMRNDDLYEGKHNFVEISFSGQFCCQKCKG